MTTAQMPTLARPSREDCLALVTDERIATFRRDGGVWIPGLIAPAWLRLIEQGISRNLKRPGPLAKMHEPGDPGEFFDDYCNYQVIPEYQILLAESPIVDVMAKLLGSERLWLYCDQIFVKEGYSQRTRWHQDEPYWVAQGEDMASMWIATQPLSEEETLEFIRGSRVLPSFDHRMAPDGEAQPPGKAPPIPDVEQERDKWDIVSHASRPGDVLVFHPGVLHGGGAMREGGFRSSLGLRMFGEGTRYIERDMAPDPAFPGIAATLRPGEPLVHSWFPQIYPRATKN